MKKILITLSAISLLSIHSIYAMPTDDEYAQELNVSIENFQAVTRQVKDSELQKIDEENACYFSCLYKKMKDALSLSCPQEERIDAIHSKFKEKMDTLHDKKQCEQRKLCKMIECDASNEEIKKQESVIEDLKKSIKEQRAEFSKQVEEQLTGQQKAEYKKFMRKECKKIKKLARYCKVYVFPCMSMHDENSNCLDGCK